MSMKGKFKGGSLFDSHSHMLGNFEIEDLDAEKTVTFQEGFLDNVMLTVRNNMDMNEKDIQKLENILSSLAEMYEVDEKESKNWFERIKYEIRSFFYRLKTSIGYMGYTFKNIYNYLIDSDRLTEDQVLGDKKRLKEIYDKSLEREVNLHKAQEKLRGMSIEDARKELDEAVKNRMEKSEDDIPANEVAKNIEKTFKRTAQKRVKINGGE